MNSIRSAFMNLSPNVRKNIYLTCLILIILIFSVLAYNAKTRSEATREKTIKVEDMLDYQEGVFEESIIQRVDRKVEDEIDKIKVSTQKKLDSLSNDIVEIKRMLKENRTSNDQQVTSSSSGRQNRGRQDIDNREHLNGNDLTQEEAYERLKQINRSINRDLAAFDPPSFQNEEEQSVEKVLPSSQDNNIQNDENGIEIFHVSQDTQKEKINYDIINLTSGSFMPGHLLTGVITSTGNNQPVPMLVRINNLAQLPNEIKEDLKGCFVVASGTAALDQERILTRLVSLSCVTRDGIAIIDEEVKGWVADQDSRPGLLAKPIAKFGAHLARSALAGFIGGLGAAVNESTYIRSRDALGGESARFKDTEIDTIFKAGIGKGIENVTSDLEKFYMDLAKSTLPVLEVGPTKNITVVLKEEAKLHIKARKNKKEEKDNKFWIKK